MRLIYLSSENRAKRAKVSRFTHRVSAFLSPLKAFFSLIKVYVSHKKNIKDITKRITKKNRARGSSFPRYFPSSSLILPLRLQFAAMLKDAWTLGSTLILLHSFCCIFAFCSTMVCTKIQETEKVERLNVALERYTISL